jgi:predicted site-specific integrase-resolvase
MEEYLTGKKASKVLGVHQKTLYAWDKKGYIEIIRTPG